MKKGQLIVIEGIDGSGKTTQVELLKGYLVSTGRSLQVVSFPRYEDNIYGKLIKRYLKGEFGDIDTVNPYLMALAFAGDRSLAKPQIKKWLSEEKLVIANRYISSSKAHMGANLPEEKREEFFKWLDELEYHTHGMPKEDLTILLSVDPMICQQNVLNIGPARHASRLAGVAGKRDIHEQNIKHLEEANKIYLSLAKGNSNWYVVDCMNGETMKTEKEIHREIVTIFESAGVIG